MKKVLLFTLLCMGVCLPAFSQQETHGFVVNQGTLIRKDFVNKIGAPVADASDFYFKTGKNEYFIKLSESKVNGQTLQQHLNKPVTLGYRLTEGNWDASSGDLQNPVQSRVGPYIVVLLLKK